MTVNALSRIEPCGFEDRIIEPLADLAVLLRTEAASLGAWLPPASAAELRGLVRMMNSYYSNLIEGHDTKPRDIEAALAGQAVEEAKRPLLEEAVAHIDIQERIDGEVLAGRLPQPPSVAFLQDVHRRFYERLDPSLRVALRPDGTEVPIEPGAFRRAGEDVVVGRHVAPAGGGEVRAEMAMFERRYRMLTQGATSRILSIPAAHHRLNYVHPFLDGNGRVSRLMSHAMVHEAGLWGQGLWSISRGLARGLRERGEYKLWMSTADQPRRGDLDGRGTLSRDALEQFAVWFLTVALDQVRFSAAVFDRATLAFRYERLVGDVLDDKRAPRLVTQVLQYGEVPRGEADRLLGTSERTARSTVRLLTAEGFLKSDGPKTALRIGFPVAHRERLFPSLFADEPIDAPPPLELPRLG